MNSSHPSPAVSSVSISTTNLTIGYGSTVVQRDLSFSLYAGEMVCMLGPNGSGKSTLLRTLAGLLPPLSGSFSICPSPYTVHRTPYTVHPSLALVLTENLSMDDTTVHDVVALGRYPYTSFLDSLSPDDESIIATSLAQVGFPSPLTSLPFREGSGLGSSPFNSHSDGEKQRILIAKALAQQTPVILLDEPTAHLDLPSRIHILRLLRTLAHEQGKTILISTHELDLALALSDRILLLSPLTVHCTPYTVHRTPYTVHPLLDTPENLKQADAFTSAFGMDIFNPLG